MRQLRPWFLSVLTLAFSASFPVNIQAQQSIASTSGATSSQVDKTSNQVDETRLTTLHGTVHPLALAKYDQGPVPASLPLNRLLLTLARPADREQALQQFLQGVHSPASPSFHKWLTPGEFGQHFGALDDDAQVVTSWLQSHGLTVTRIASNRTTVEFSGSAAQLSEALHTEIHTYTAKGKTFYANAREIAVPEAIHARVAAFAPLNNLPLDSYAAPVGPALYSRDSHRATRIASPQFTLTENNQPFYALAPEDFATQYDLAPVYSAGITGSGQTIGIIGTSNINLALVDAYRKLFNLPADHTQLIIDGTDPGDPLSPNIEAFLDTEVSGSVAPAATVNLYIAGGQPLTNSLELAAMRAVEDNQASVLSVSYGNCELLLGSANQFWNALWEQAAAQGQTVFVSSGDSGPTTCTIDGITDNGGLAPVSTLSVNGISSTPWNVSVGGTDFYYSDYATGAPSAATLWNSSNDASNGSLKAPLPEQPWDNAFGLNAIPFNFQDILIPSAAGGGGVSNCTTVDSTATSASSCVSGYPKPAWQNAPGVPNDSARDLPDVSLFAANTANFSAWPICADPGDCSASSTSDPQIFLVGGTSASSPAMAGIMALIDQKYGRQGQANYTLYALARKDPSIFHDITLGTNNVLCLSGMGSFCATPVAAVPDPFIASFGLYPAGPGYDLASGLGSIDAGKLFTAWNTTSFTPSATTLQVAPATFVHGATAAITVAVTASTGSAAPTGNVALTTSSISAALRNNPAIPLTNGAASASLSSLPGGTYNLVAQYSGDTTFAPSTSSPVALTVTPETSTTKLNLLTEVVTTSSTPANPPTLSTEPYGSAFSFEALPVSSAATTASTLTPLSGNATGTVTFTDGSTSATIPLNINGVASWNPQVLAVGAHSVTAAYSGDASYTASMSSPLAITVVKGTPLFEAAPEAQELASFPAAGGVQLSYAAGENLVIHILLRGNTFSIPPSGTVTVNLGSMTQTVALNPNEYLNENLANAFVTFPAVPSGTYTLTATYSGDSNWNTGTYTAPNPLTFVTSTSSTSTTVLTISPGAVDSSGTVTIKATVTDAAAQSSTQSNASEGLVALFANGTSFCCIIVASSTSASSAGISTGTATFPASVLPLGTLQIVGVYYGGNNDLSSTSAPVPLTVTASDFSLSIAASALAIKSGQTATLPVLLAGPYGVGVPITLACASPSTAITCAVSPGSSTVTGTGTATLTINTFTTTTSAALTMPEAPASHPGSLAGFAATSAALAFIVLLPFRRRRLPNALLNLLLLAAASTLIACSGSGGGTSNPVPPPTPPPVITNAPAGAYSVTVTATSGGITHNAAIAFNIQ